MELLLVVFDIFAMRQFPIEKNAIFKLEMHGKLREICFKILDLKGPKKKIFILQIQ